MSYIFQEVTGTDGALSFQFNGQFALKNYNVEIVNGNRLKVVSTTNEMFSLLEAEVSEVEINGQIYSDANAAKVALQTLIYSNSTPVVLTEEKYLQLAAAVQAADRGKILPDSPIPSGGWQTGWYTAGLATSADPGTNYPNQNNLKAKKGFITKFLFNGALWDVVEYEIPKATQYIAPFIGSIFPIVGPAQRTYNESIWEIPSGENSVSTDLPGESAKWIKVVKNITTEKIGNLFDVNKITDGFYINSGNGNLMPDSGFYLSDFIELKEGSTYSRSNENQWLSFYDSTKTYQGFSVGGNYTVAAGIKYARIVFAKTNNQIDPYYTFAENITPIPYSPPTQISEIFTNITSSYFSLVFNFLGDSITYGFGLFANRERARFSALITAKLRLSKENNYGVSSSCVSKYPGKTDSFVERSTTIDSNADVTVIYGGVNDYRSSIALGTVSSNDEFTFIPAYKKMIENILSANPDAEIYLITPTHDNSDGLPYNYDFVNGAGHTLKDYADAIKMLGQRFSLPVIDLFSESGINIITKDIYCTDGLHLSVLGYKKITEIIISKLQRK